MYEDLGDLGTRNGTSSACYLKGKGKKSKDVCSPWIWPMCCVSSCLRTEPRKLHVVATWEHRCPCLKYKWRTESGQTTKTSRPPLILWENKKTSWIFQLDGPFFMFFYPLPGHFHTPIPLAPTARCGGPKRPGGVARGRLGRARIVDGMILAQFFGSCGLETRLGDCTITS